ncbi:MAG: hypothetical protein ACI831_001761, partial [Candidatus Azotimanducaceae bacterium]
AGVLPLNYTRIVDLMVSPAAFIANTIGNCKSFGNSPK